MSLEGNFGRELKGKEPSRTRMTDAKVANKNEPTSLVGLEQNAAGTQPTY